MKTGKTQKLVYDFMIQQIETDAWLEGFHIIEQDIANELKVSRTPIRSAIAQLINENYLVKTPNRGVIVKKKKIGNKEFVERTQLIELLCSHYLFQLQIKEYLIDDIMFNELNRLKKQRLHDKECYYDEFWQRFLEPLQNDLMKQSILNHTNALKLVDFPKVSIVFLYDETIKLSKKVSDLIQSKQYDLARKEIRVYINRLNLELIDQQI